MKHRNIIYRFYDWDAADLKSKGLFYSNKSTYSHLQEQEATDSTASTVCHQQ